MVQHALASCLPLLSLDLFHLLRSARPLVDQFLSSLVSSATQEISASFATRQPTTHDPYFKNNRVALAIMVSFILSLGFCRQAREGMATLQLCSPTVVVRELPTWSPKPYRRLEGLHWK